MTRGPSLELSHGASSSCYPDLLGTYGDGGNGLVLARRAAWRGIDVELVQAHSGRAAARPAELYCLGGGEDGPQVRAAEALRSDGVLERAIDRRRRGLRGVRRLPVARRRLPRRRRHRARRPRAARRDHRKGIGRRAVGEVVARRAPDGPTLADGPAAAAPHRFREPRRGHDRRRPGPSPLAEVVTGVGNGVRRQDRGGVVGTGARHLSARPGPGPQPAPGRPAPRVGPGRAGRVPAPATRAARRPRRRRSGPSAWPPRQPVGGGCRAAAGPAAEIDRISREG